jgi:hypothetical protein
MSDSIKKYNELVRDGLIKPETVKAKKLSRPFYSELELVETVATLARQHRELEPNLLLEIAKDELSVKRVCD